MAWLIAPVSAAAVGVFVTGMCAFSELTIGMAFIGSVPISTSGVW